MYELKLRGRNVEELRNKVKIVKAISNTLKWNLD
jgi:hypothetical protein